MAIVMLLEEEAFTFFTVLIFLITFILTVLAGFLNVVRSTILWVCITDAIGTTISK